MRILTILILLVCGFLLYMLGWSNCWNEIEEKCNDNWIRYYNRPDQLSYWKLRTKKESLYDNI